MTARPSPTTRRAALLRIPSTGPGCTRASCSSFVSTPTAPPRASPGPGSGRSASAPRWPAVVATVLVLVAFGALGGRHRSPLPPPVVTNPSDVVDYAVAERVGADGGARAWSRCRVRSRRRHPAGRVRRGAWRPTGSSPRPTSSTGRPTVDRRAPTGQLARRQGGGHRPADRPRPARRCRGGDLQLARLGGVDDRRASARPSSRSAPGAATTAVGINVVSDRDVMVDAGTGVDVAGLLETGITGHRRDGGRRAGRPDGNLVGILTRAAGGSPDGLAVPVATVRDVRDQLDGSGKVDPRLAGRAVREGPTPRPARRRRASCRRWSPAARPPKAGSGRRRRGRPRRRRRA